MKKIQRIADNKYLVNVATDVWTDDVNEAKAFRQGELNMVKIKLFAKGVKPEDIKEIEA